MADTARSRWIIGAVLLAGTAGLVSGCGPKSPKKAPPPPPAVVVIPPRPAPPLGASPNLPIPAMGADGMRKTVNSNLSTAQAVWNLRSALNVAALNCLEPQYAPILAGYKSLLKVQSKALAAANKALDKEFRDRFGAKTSTRARETYQTQVYNFFALPPVVPAFCNAAMAISAELATVPAGKLDSYAYVGLAKAEQPYRQFFDSYDQYRADLTAWEMRYGGGSVAVAAPVSTPTSAQAASQ